MKKHKGFLILLFVIFFAECKESEKLSPDPNIPIEVDWRIFGIDISNKIILYNGESKSISNNQLTIGENALDIQTSDNELVIGKAYDVTYGGNEYSLFYSELPIIAISAQGKNIVDDPKVNGELYLLEKGKTFSFYQIGIELRGGVSKTYPKKSYSVELWADQSGTEKEKVSLLGMREDDDWILDGLWNEPLRIRDYTAHSLWLEMGRVQNKNPKTKTGIDRKYCELFLNGKYTGVYYLGEKIDRKQLDLTKNNLQLEGELYKGYTWADGVTYDGVEGFDNNDLTWSGYEAKYPKDVGEVDWSNLHDLVNFIVNSSQQDFENEIFDRMDIDNVIDYFIFLNIMYGWDNTGKNVYTGRINSVSKYFFIPWDMDGTFGNNWKGERIDNEKGILSNGLYKRLLEFPVFKNELKLRWNELSASQIQSTFISNSFQKNYNLLEENGVYAREAMVPGIAFNYSTSEIDFIISWIDRRVAYLDAYFNNL